MNISPHRVRIWVFSQRQNKTTRPNAAISDDDPLLTVNDIQNTMAPRSTNLQLFLHVLPEEKRVTHNSTVETFLIFLKYFSVRKQTISGFASILMKRSSKVHTLSRYICQAMGWDADVPLKYFEEIKPGMIETMIPTATFEQSEIGNGDIICFQHMPTKKEALALRSQGLIPSAIEFYEFLHSRMMVHFKARSENDSGECFDLVLSKDMDYAAISRAVGIHLMWDPLKLRFTTVQSNGEPKKVSRRSYEPLSELLSKASTTHGKPTILYELRETSPTELTMEHHVMVLLYYGNGQDIIFSFWLPKRNLVFEVLELVAKRGGVKITHSRSILLFSTTEDARPLEKLNPGETIEIIDRPARFIAMVTTRKPSH
ncbi:hypothetical protein M408DRAFT_30582 [Serendipita vermifera MAFF 305830]|uniref:Ubiquitin carboxyl-terminal hydrolase 7 ICP0-binding domain-containing protein n=1 Tax=Serendipita vermifera MAFF 305830 TaxID=933852 RepID=A0A0C3ALN2_SERVB|nr:hypothetical protein M408DRAFT_30582 [Serendipita vermifera MAFF 305830]